MDGEVAKLALAPRVSTLDAVERRWRAITERSSETALMVDANGVVIYASASLTNVLGYAPEEFIGRLGFDFVHPDDVEHVAAQFFNVASSPGAIATARARGLRKSGDWFWGEATAKNYLDDPAIRAIVVNLRDVSDHEEAVQRQAELDARLRAHAAALRAVLSASADDIYMFDREGRCLMVSEGGAKAVGRASSEMLGLSLGELGLAAELSSALQANLQQVFDEQQPLRSEMQLPSPQGRRYFEYVITPVCEGERAEMATVVSREITARKEMEDALREREERLRAALAAANLGTWDVDLVNNTLHDDERLAQMLDLPPCDGIRPPEQWLNRIHPDDRQRVQSEFLNAVAGASDYDTTHRIILPDGAVRWVAPKCTIVRDDSGRALRAIGVCADITEARRAEAVLRDSEARFRRLVESDIFGVTFTSFDGRIIYANDYFLKMLGYTCDDLHDGLVRWDVLAAGERRAAAEKAASADSSLPLETEYLRKDGSRAPVLVGSATLAADGDREGTVIGFFLDLTERRRTEEALREADRRKDEFLAMLAHELRNPLAPILNAVQILHLIGSEEAPVKQQRDVIERQVRQMKLLLDDLLDVSRITQGKVQLSREIVDLSGILAQAVEGSRPFIEAKGHELCLALAPVPMPLSADRLRLAQVFTNLLNNAAKYTDAGGRISLTAERSEEHAQVRVRDSGIGMTPEVLANAFELFAQADGSLDHSQGGLGIGLTVARRLAEMHGGSISAHSDGLGFGSEFVVTLPLTSQGPCETHVRGGPSRGTTIPARRILVVDDNVDAAHSLGLLLRLQGHEVRVAFDGQECLDVADEFNPEIVVLDIGLPKLDGYQAAQALKARSAGQSILLIAVSGYGQEEYRRRSLEAGFAHHFVKPLDSAALHEFIAAAGSRLPSRNAGLHSDEPPELTPFVPAKNGAPR